MSKRFGRNQKRALKEALARKTHQAFEFEQLLKYQRERMQSLASTIARVENMLGPYFVGLEPKTVYTGIPVDHPCVEIPMIERSPFDFTDQNMAALNHKLNRLHKIIPKVKYDNLMMKTHARLQHKDGTVTYAISDEALLDTPRDYICRHVAQDMAEYLMRTLPR
jgi:hypothetical protein